MPSIHPLTLSCASQQTSIFRQSRGICNARLRWSKARNEWSAPACSPAPSDRGYSRKPMHRTVLSQLHSAMPSFGGPCDVVLCRSRAVYARQR